MSEENQINVPASFIALHADARGRLTSPIRLVRERYEACEDLAQHLVEHSAALQRDVRGEREELLRRCHAGLCAQGSGVSAREAGWVVRRLAELLNWPDPGEMVDEEES